MCVLLWRGAHSDNASAAVTYLDANKPDLRSLMRVKVDPFFSGFEAVTCVLPLVALL